MMLYTILYNMCYIHISMVIHDYKLCDTAVRTEYVLPVTSPVSLRTQTSFTTHSVQYIQYTLSVHFTLVVNPLLTTIVHHFFSSVLAEPQYIY